MVGDNCVSESGLAAIVGRDKRYQICGSAHGFLEAGQLIRQHRPDILLIEPFLEDRDGILWIKELAREYWHTRILIVSQQSEHVYAERALHAGATGYWMKNGSPEELMRAVETVMAGEIYTSPSITALAILRFAHRADLPKRLDAPTSSTRWATRTQKNSSMVRANCSDQGKSTRASHTTVT